MSYHYLGCPGCKSHGSLAGPVEDFLFQFEPIKQANKAVQDLTTSAQRASEEVGDKFAKELCKVSPVDDLLRDKNLNSGLGVVLKYAPIFTSASALAFPPALLITAVPMLLLDIQRTCTVSQTLRTQAATLRDIAFVCAIVGPILQLPGVQTAITAALASATVGVGGAAYLGVATALTALGGTYGVWADIAAGRGISGLSLVGAATGVVSAVLALVSQGVISPAMLGAAGPAVSAAAAGMTGLSALWATASPLINAAKKAEKDAAALSKQGQSIDRKKNETISKLRQEIGTASKPGPLGATLKNTATQNARKFLGVAPPKSTAQPGNNNSTGTRTTTQNKPNSTATLLLLAGAGAAAVVGAPVWVPIGAGALALLTLKKK